MALAVDELPNPRNPRRRVLGLIAGTVVLAFLALAVIDGWGKVSAFDWQFHLGWLVLGAVACVAALLGMGLGYVLILERLADRRLPRMHLLSVWARSILARYVPGNVLMVAGRVVLGREAGVTGRASVAASVYEQAFVLGTGAACSAVLVVAIADLAQHAWAWLVLVLPLGLVLLHPRIFGVLANAGLRRLRREPLEVFLSVREVLTFGALYLAISGFIGISMWAFVHALTGPEAGGPFLVGAGFLLAFSLSMIAFVFPSGLGVREGVFALVLSRNLPTEVAIAAAAASRMAMTVIEVGFTGAVLAIERWRTRHART